MAHGSASIHKCDKCKTYGMMPRFGSKGMKYICTECDKKTKKSSKEDGKLLEYTWIGWY